MDRKYVEKLLIAIVLFLGVTIGTAGIIGTCTAINNKHKVPDPVGSIIIGNINVL